MFSSEKKVIISSQAYLSILSETYSYIDRETGGVFLGIVKDNVWYILENIDPGYKKIQRQHSYFEYDAEYVTHLANVRTRLYEVKLSLLGLWHRHPGSFDRFSTTDNGTNLRFAELIPEGAISALINLDPDFRFTFYHVSLPLTYTVVENILVGDSHIPKEFQCFKNPTNILNNNFGTITESKRNLKEPWGRMKKVFTFTPSEKKEIKKLEATPIQEILLDMLEKEQIEYLDKQEDYTYEFRMVGKSIEIEMSYIGTMPYYPEKLYCSLLIENNQPLIIMNKNRYSYTTNIIYNYINEIITQRISSTDTNFADKKEIIRNYESILELPNEYDLKTLRIAYIIKMKEYHPDKWINENNIDIIDNANLYTQKIEEAYRFLIKERNKINE